jgi:hypothetical protein
MAETEVNWLDEMYKVINNSPNGVSQEDYDRIEELRKIRHKHPTDEELLDRVQWKLYNHKF